MTKDSHRSQNNSNSDADLPYSLVSLPPRLQLNNVIGINRLHQNYLNGKISLKLKVKTNTLISTGIIALGRDIPGITGYIPDLVKTAVQNDKGLIIPGSSLKGVIRSAYEAITLSCLCKTTKEAQINKWIPHNLRECEINKSQNQLKICPACQVFGALNWQGLVRFQDAICEKDGQKKQFKFIPSFYPPKPKPQNKQTKEVFYNSRYFDNNKKVRGRKFYRHAVYAVENGQRGIYTQQAEFEYTFTTQISFMNLSLAQLGTILIILGQDKLNNPLALKVGAGKPRGWGTITVEVINIENTLDLYKRYLSLEPEIVLLTGERLENLKREAIENAHRYLVQEKQLKELSLIWKYPTDYLAPEGNY